MKTLCLDEIFKHAGKICGDYYFNNLSIGIPYNTLCTQTNAVITRYSAVFGKDPSKTHLGHVSFISQLHKFITNSEQHKPPESKAEEQNQKESLTEKQKQAKFTLLGALLLVLVTIDKTQYKRSESPRVENQAFFSVSKLKSLKNSIYSPNPNNSVLRDAIAEILYQDPSKYLDSFTGFLALQEIQRYITERPEHEKEKGIMPELLNVLEPTLQEYEKKLDVKPHIGNVGIILLVYYLQKMFNIYKDFLLTKDLKKELGKIGKGDPRFNLYTEITKFRAEDEVTYKDNVNFYLGWLLLGAMEFVRRYCEGELLKSANPLNMSDERMLMIVMVNREHRKEKQRSPFTKIEISEYLKRYGMNPDEIKNVKELQKTNNQKNPIGVMDAIASECIRRLGLNHIKNYCSIENHFKETPELSLDLKTRSECLGEFCTFIQSVNGLDIPFQKLQLLWQSMDLFLQSVNKIKNDIGTYTYKTLLKAGEHPTESQKPEQRGISMGMS